MVLMHEFDRNVLLLINFTITNYMYFIIILSIIILRDYWIIYITNRFKEFFFYYETLPIVENPQYIYGKV